MELDHLFRPADRHVSTNYDAILSSPNSKESDGRHTREDAPWIVRT